MTQNEMLITLVTIAQYPFHSKTNNETIYCKPF